VTWLYPHPVFRSELIVIAIDTRRDMLTGLHIWSSTIISSIIRTLFGTCSVQSEADAYGS